MGFVLIPQAHIGKKKKKNLLELFGGISFHCLIIME